MSNDDQLINDFANRSFRDLADQDYVSARVAYRNEFDQQFRWCSLQAIEKYLKAILLYNRVPTKGLGHNLNNALKRVKNVTDLEFSVPPDVEKFINYISVYGADRYLSHSTYLKMESLLLLDKSVWYIRRYCFFMRQGANLFEHNKQRATNPYYESCWHKYKIAGGYLEKIVNKRLPAYDYLVWKNFYYGRVKKHKIKNYKFRMSSQNPTHILHKEIFVTLDKLVDFPQTIKNLYKN